MPTTDILRALIQGVVEGITEFLPVSSTGHMRLVKHWMGPIVNDSFNSTFDIFIQIGAIAAVLVFFRRKLLDLIGVAQPAGPGFTPLTPPQRRHSLLIIALATLPLAPGYLLAKKSDHFFETHPQTEPLAIALALAIGGVLMIAIELLRPKSQLANHQSEISNPPSDISQITIPQALVIGSCQILAAVFPGTSRSAATIMPALLMRLPRPVAAEFSFFLAIPALFAAAGIKLLKFLRSPDAHAFEYLLLAIGTLTAFLVAYAVIAVFMNFIRKYTFTPFGIYRIVLALAVYLLLKA